MNRDIAASVWAKNMGGTTIIKYLAVGERFTFPQSETVMVYRGRGWYSPEGSKQRFRTGIRTAARQLAAN